MTLIGTMMVSSMGMVFAEEKSVPAHINVPATAIDYSVTEKIEMQGAANSTDLTIDSLDVTNNLKAGVLNIDSVEATGDNGWTIVGDDSDFVKMGKNAHKFSMVADGSHDMSTGAYADAGQVNPGEKDTTTFTGKTGITTEAINDEKAANVVVTVSLAKGTEAGEEIQYEDFELTNETLEMLGYERQDGYKIINTETQKEVTKIVIPETFEYDGHNYKVIGIGETVFADCENIKSISIPEGVTNIGEAAFSGCSNMITIQIPDSVNSIGDYIFDTCNSLGAVYTDNEVVKEYIADNFNQEVTFKPYSEYPRFDDEGVIGTATVTQLNRDTISKYEIGSDGGWSAIIPSITEDDTGKYKVIGIESGAFFDVGKLVKVDISEGIETIGETAFMNSAKLSEISIPNSVTEIGAGAFSGTGIMTVYTDNEIALSYDWESDLGYTPEFKSYSEFVRK